MRKVIANYICAFVTFMSCVGCLYLVITTSGFVGIQIIFTIGATVYFVFSMCSLVDGIKLQIKEK